MIYVKVMELSPGVARRGNQSRDTNPHLPRSPVGSHGALELMAVSITGEALRTKCSGGKRADGLPRWGSRDTADRRRRLWFRSRAGDGAQQ